MSKNSKSRDEREDTMSNEARSRGGRRNGKKRPYNKTGKLSKEVRESGSNDPSWYSQSPELLRDSASIPFSWPVGTPLNTSKKIGNDIVPGIEVIEVTPTVGTSLDQNSPVNVAASAIYSWVRHANSGHSNYDAPDLMIYLLAMSNVYSLITWLQRIYGYVNTYDQRNRYLPRAVVEAMRVDFDSIRDNLANFRYFINAFINKVASLAVPNTMPIFNRLAFLYSNVYIEGPSIKDQLYMYNPEGLKWYKFGLNTTTGAGELTLTPIIETASVDLVTFDDIKTYATDLFNAIWEQEDFGIMSGDIIKAYDSNVIKLAPVPEVMPMLPVYDALVLHQMKNAKCYGGFNISKISQSENGEILQAILIAGDAVSQRVKFELMKADKVLSTDFDNPTPDVVIESTRLMPAYDEYRGQVCAGTEIPIRAVMYYYNTGGGLVSSVINWQTYHPADMTSQEIVNITRIPAVMMNFRYSPELNMIEMPANDEIIDGAILRYWDIDNYAVLSNDDLIKMHETALLSLFAIPAIAKIS